MLNYRTALTADLPTMMKMVEEAKEGFRSRNIDQWQKVEPNEQGLTEGIEKSVVHVLEENGEVLGMITVVPGPEADYAVIDGAWLNDEPYAGGHRVASTGIIKGAASYCLDWAYSQIPNLRMDTYRDNIPMQKLLEKCGFQYCGSFERLGTDKWMAYHKA